MSSTRVDEVGLDVVGAVGGQAGVEALARRAPGRPPIETERIVEAALEIADTEGIAALTTRSVAARLNSSTSTLYRHFPDRAALIGAVIDRILGEIDVAVDSYAGLGWRESCQKVAESIFDAFRAHRQASLLLADHAPIGPNAAAVRERMLATLLDGGFDTHLAARSSAMVGHLVLGFAVQLGGEPDIDDTKREAFRKAIRALDLSRLPATTAVMNARWTPTTIEEEFSFALEMALDGLTSLRERTTF